MEENFSPLKDMMNTPIFRKAEEILKIVSSLVEDLPEGDEFEYLKRFLMEDASCIPAKLAGASGDQIYSIKMTNASIIRKACLDLYVMKHNFPKEVYVNQEYFQLLRDTIDEFKELFIDWVDTFDPWNYIKDDWNLFNPPGVHARDKDPDDDIPFDNPLGD